MGKRRGKSIDAFSCCILEKGAKDVPRKNGGGKDLLIFLPPLLSTSRERRGKRGESSILKRKRREGRERGFLILPINESGEERTLGGKDFCKVHPPRGEKEGPISFPKGKKVLEEAFSFEGGLLSSTKRREISFP